MTRRGPATPANDPAVRPLADLGDGNAGTRSISEAAAAGLGYSLAEFADLSGIVVNSTAKGPEKIAGHQRLAQLEAAGATDLVVEREPEGDVEGAGYVLHPKTAARFPVRIVRWSARKAKAARYAANAATIAGEFTALALPELRALAALPELAPLRLDDLARMIPGPPVETVEDEAPEPPVNPVSRTGDLWLLGAHRLLCGDSTKAEDVARVLSGAKPRLVVTDPPYGVDYDPDWRGRMAESRPSLRMGNKRGRGRVSPVANDHKADWLAAYKLFPGEVAYVWHAGIGAADVARGLAEVGLHVRAQIVWCKPNAIFSRGHYHWQHEPCWYAVRGGKKAWWIGDRKQSTVWTLTPPGDPYKRGEEGVSTHSAQKPVEAMARPLRNHDAPEVYDPFLGSGTTLIAAEREKRRCFGCDIEPIWIDVTIARWQKISGGVARLALPSGEPGPTFPEVAADRGIVLPSEGEG